MLEIVPSPVEIVAELNSEIEAVLTPRVEEAADRAEAELQRRSPVDTGRFRAGWSTTVSGSWQAGWTIVASNDVSYAGHVVDRWFPEASQIFADAVGQIVDL